MKKQVSMIPAFLICIGMLASIAIGQGNYKAPPKAIMDVLNSPTIPGTSISPTHDRIALLEPLRYPPISELAQPMLRLAGVRVNPNTNGQHRQPYAVGMKIKTIADGKEMAVALPAGAQIIQPQWSPDGKFIAAGNVTPAGVELWIIDAGTAKATKVKNVLVNTAFGGFSWEGPRTISATLVPSKRGPAPGYQNLTPSEPSIQETSGRTGVVATYQDLLKNPNDEKLFEHYATSQLASIDVDGRVHEIGSPAIFDEANFSPDGKFILTTRIERPFSYQFPYSRFPKKVEIWDASGKFVKTIANSPLQNNLPAQGVPVGPRSVNWVPTEPAMLMWTEALDDGDPRKKVSHRDKIMSWAAPFSAGPAEVLKTEQRHQGRTLGERDGLMIYFDYNRDTQRRRMFAADYRSPSTTKLISDLSARDRYNDIGNPVTKTLPNGRNVVRQSGDHIFLSGAGASPDGDRPFLRKMNLKTLETEELFRSGVEEYEAFAGFYDEGATQILTRRESVANPPNIFLRIAPCQKGTTCLPVAVTDFKDPSPQIRGIQKQLVKYKRADGVDLSFTLYTPPGHKPGTPLPTLVWAYPLEFTDPSTAGQVSGSTDRFTQIGGISHLFFVLQGYAVLDNATMPVVGDPLTVNDTFVKQVVDSAQAAIDKGVEMGVVDRERVGVGGHSYGAFMTANLLAHSDMFRAGIARSGAYNRTLTPFGFQSERRTFWDAPDLYAKVSPFFVANKINEPILLMHGEADNNQGTFPMQSERLFAAISGNGGTARLVMLPLESHGYSARESVEHTLYEMLEWFDKHVKNAKPRPANQASSR
jgi:dipeptidyl aminopeptidase/acylaminoacyl peptidase